jgi:hypothetical protein
MIKKGSTGLESTLAHLLLQNCLLLPFQLLRDSLALRLCGLSLLLFFLGRHDPDCLSHISISNREKTEKQGQRECTRLVTLGVLLQLSYKLDICALSLVLELNVPLLNFGIVFLSHQTMETEEIETETHLEQLFRLWHHIVDQCRTADTEHRRAAILSSASVSIDTKGMLHTLPSSSRTPLPSFSVVIRGLMC